MAAVHSWRPVEDAETGRVKSYVANTLVHSCSDAEVSTEWPSDSAEIDRYYSSEELAEWQADADAKGYGKMYAAMGGGRGGLQACAAGGPILYPVPYILHAIMKRFVMYPDAD